MAISITGIRNFVSTAAQNTRQFVGTAAHNTRQFAGVVGQGVSHRAGVAWTATKPWLTGKLAKGTAITAGVVGTLGTAAYAVSAIRGSRQYRPDPESMINPNTMPMPQMGFAMPPQQETLMGQPLVLNGPTAQRVRPQMFAGQGQAMGGPGQPEIELAPGSQIG